MACALIALLPHNVERFIHAVGEGNKVLFEHHDLVALEFTAGELLALHNGHEHVTPAVFLDVKEVGSVLPVYP